MRNNQKDKGKKFILLIEDEEIMIHLLQKRLEKGGYLVKVARDGEAGLKMVRELQPDLVLLDMLLPKLNGFAILEKLYGEKIIPKLPTIIVSNSGQPIEIENALKMGVRDYLIKVNFDPEELLMKVGRIFVEENGPEAEAHVPEAGGAGAKGADILILEDDIFLSELLSKKFAQKNFRIRKALNVNQAHKALESSPPDLILLDIVLPGMDGLTFLGELKQDERYKDIPVMIISNLGQQDAVERGKRAGAADYIVKANVTPSEIIEKVESLLANKST